MSQDKNGPIVTVLNYTPIQLLEFASHMPIGTHETSDNAFVKTKGQTKVDINDPATPLADKVIKAYHHTSVAEHSSITLYVDNITRGVLQELSRHRIGVSLTVLSTRYSVQSIIYAFILSFNINPLERRKEMFKSLIMNQRVFITELDPQPELDFMYGKLLLINKTFGDNSSINQEFLESIMSKEAITLYNTYKNVMHYNNLFIALSNCKRKKNAGDIIKECVTDTWRTELTITFNIRSLASFLKLRNSGAAYAPMRSLAHEIIRVLPPEYKAMLNPSLVKLPEDKE